MGETVGRIEFSNPRNSINYDESCEECLAEMFKRVGAKYPWLELTRYKEWYNRRTWTEDEENDFKKWMRSFLKKRYRWTKKKLEWEIDMFLLMWGWKTNIGGE